MPNGKPAAFVILGLRPERGLSDMALLKILQRINRGDLMAHGFCSTVRDWAEEANDHPAELTEIARAQVMLDKVEAAYRRGDLFNKRRALMEDWARECGSDHLPFCDTPDRRPPSRNPR